MRSMRSTGGPPTRSRPRWASPITNRLILSCPRPLSTHSGRTPNAADRQAAWRTERQGRQRLSIIASSWRRLEILNAISWPGPPSSGLGLALASGRVDSYDGYQAARPPSRRRPACSRPAPPSSAKIRLSATGGAVWPPPSGRQPASVSQPTRLLPGRVPNYIWFGR